MAAAISHQQHCVIGQLEGVKVVSQACVVVDSPLVAHEVRVDLWFDQQILNIIKEIFNIKVMF